MTWGAALAWRVLRHCERPVILVDWTKLSDRHVAIRASVAFQGRSVVILTEPRPSRLLGNRKMQQSFLRKLKKVVPSQCRPIVVTDIGFLGPWFEDVLRVGWDFVGRLRGDLTPRRCREEPCQVVAYQKKIATHQPEDHGQHLLRLKAPYEARIVTYDGRSRRASRRRRTLPRKNSDRKNVLRATRP